MSKTSVTTQNDDKTAKRDTRLPPMFAREKHVFGWQGLTITLPENWNLAQFGGTHFKGQVRIDDEDGPRLELSWEQVSKGIDIEKSVAKFLRVLERNAKKRRVRFVAEEKARILSKSRTRKAQLANFGWTGERDEIAGQGWGMAWQCAECGRVVVAHLIGRGAERPERVRELATTLLESLECHGQGGWETWSVFDLRLEIPLEFKLERARLVTGKLELDWIRPRTPGVLAWTQRDERLALSRFALASTILQDEKIEEWATRVVKPLDKKRSYGKFAPTEIVGKNGALARGALKDFRRRYTVFALDWVLRRARQHTELRVWHDEDSNKLFALRSEISPLNAHIIDDVLDSLQ